MTSCSSKTLFILLLAAAAGLSGCNLAADGPEDFTRFVNVKIGSGGHGHVFVGASVPFGAVQLGPTSIPQAWDWCSGYHESDSTVIGFSHTHLSGTGIGDLFDLTLMPVVGAVEYARGAGPADGSPEAIAAAQATGLWSYADRRREIAQPGYYAVPLTRYGIKAEMTATDRVGFSRYTFPESEEAAVVIDLENGGCWDKATETRLEVVDSCSVRGCRFSTGWARDQKLFFFATFSKPFRSFETIPAQAGGGTYGRASFKTAAGEQILVKVALSPVSDGNALMNMDGDALTQQEKWDFDAVAEAAREAWNKELSRIRIRTADADAKTVFYTALYHTMIAPSLFCDVNGNYRGADGEVHPYDSFTNYTIFSLWDTYRAQMPLMTILHPDREADMVNTMLGICEQQGRLPVWHLAGNETDCMVGNPGIIAVADAIVKDIGGVDQERAWNAIKTTATGTDRGQDLRQRYGFIPSDLYNESIGNDMEYAIADGAAAQAAGHLGKTEDAAFFRKRSCSYRHYLDPETLQARGRFADGSWRTPFNPFLSNHREQDYVEGTAWQYTWLVPQDFDGLVDFYGSREKFVERLDSLFLADSRIDGENVSSDISGLIGQYVHGNEPSHHIIYFYTMAGEPGKAADRLREVYATMYFNHPNGLAGNEDCGQMSAWYILSTLGFYEAEPASTRFWFGAPLFDEAVLQVPGGEFRVKAEGLDARNRYIQSVTLNGRSHDKGFLEYSDIMAGGELVFRMGPEPRLWY